MLESLDVPPWSKAAPKRTPRIVYGLATRAYQNRVVHGGVLIYTEAYKEKFRPKSPAEQKTLLDGFAKLKSDPSAAAAPLYLLGLDPEIALHTWNDREISFGC